jgi:hypothetical protein
MSIQNWPGGVIGDVPPTPSGPYENSTASGVWTIQQAADYVKQGNWPTAGNVDPSAFIENLFSTYLYTGNGSTQTITNGIDLAGEGGLVWVKNRTNAVAHRVYDTNRGVYQELYTNLTDAQVDRTSISAGLSSFNGDGFSFGNNNYNGTNESGVNYVSWTFRKQPKFFDVVTYTGDGVAGRTVAHNLGSVPGTIIVKRTSSAGGWNVYHRSLGATKFLFLDTTDAELTASNRWNDTAPTSSVFTLGADAGVNGSGSTYVAYLFAHNAGGFGLTGTDNVISCGSYTGTGAAGNFVSLGYEPQWVLIKSTIESGNWSLYDNMRGVPTGPDDLILYPNTSGAEEATGAANDIDFNATGFTLQRLTSRLNNADQNYIYIAIRRGPMKVPTDGTSVFAPLAVNNATGTANTTGFPVDMRLLAVRGITANKIADDRLRGVSTNTTESGQVLQTTTSNDESSSTTTLGWDNTGFKTPSGYASADMVYWNFQRAPGFFDVVCYTATPGTPLTLTHNLTVAPELIFVKGRANGGTNWRVYAAPLGNTKGLNLNLTGAASTSSGFWNNTSPTATQFTVGTENTVNSAGTYVAYLFATCPGVSKVGSYTGNGATQDIACGFTGGARFVLIKRTDATGNWYVYDTARGMTMLTDPYLLLNSTAAETATLGSVTTTAGGFTVDATILAAINTNAASYIFLAVA